MANLTNSAKLIEEMNKKANRTELPEVNNSTVNFTINGNTWSQSMTTNQASNSTVNLTVTKATVWLGNVDNTSDANKPISTATQAALDLKADKSDLSSVYKYKWSVASYSNLPSTWLTAWDVYNVADSWMNYAWTGSAWDALGSSVDLSNYIAKNNTTAFTPTGDYNPATKKYVDDNKTEYHAWEWISIGEWQVNARKWPSPDGFHVPSRQDWQWVKSIMNWLWFTKWNQFKTNLHMPMSWYRNYTDTSIQNYWTIWEYLTTNWLPFLDENNNIWTLQIKGDTTVSIHWQSPSLGCNIRSFKDSYVTPDSTWTVIQWTLWSAWIFWNQNEWLISITNSSTGYTIMDKNLWATTVYNDWDTLTQANMWNMYQWWNNYWFPSTWTISNTSSTQVDTSSYWPANPYSSNTFITWNLNWSSIRNRDLWWDISWTITQENVISNTGVLSVNGQTWNVTISSPDMSNYIAKNNTTAFTPSGNYNPATKKYVDDNKWTKVEIVTQTQYDNIWSEKLTNGVLYWIKKS